MTAAILDLKIPRRRSPTAAQMVNAAQIGILLLAGMVPLPWLPAISAVCCALGSELYRAFSKAFHTCHPCSATQTARTAHAVAFKPGCGSMIWFTDQSA